jgi:hypothetical protein
VKSVGFERFAGVFFGDGTEGAGASEINGKSEEEDEDGEEAGLDVHGVEEEAREGFVDDVDGGEDEQAGLDKGGEIFEFAVAVRVALVGGLVSNADGKEGDDGGDKIESGMECFRKNTETAGAEDEKGFQAEEQDGRANAEEGSALFFL